MRGRVPATLGWLVPAVCAVAYVISLVMFTAASAGPIILVQLIAFLAFPIVGALIVTQRPRNTVGWIFCAIGLGTAITAFSAAFVAHAVTVHADARLSTGIVDALGDLVWPVNLGLGLSLLLLFPEGRLPSRRWRPLLWIVVILIAVDAFSTGLHPGPLESGGRVPNPFGIPGAAPLMDALLAIAQPLTIPVALAVILSVIVRYRRASGAQRQQIKWFVYGGVSAVLLIFVSQFLATLVTPPGQDPSNGVIVDLGSSLAFVALPVGAGIGVLRYRLYDIDVIIRRTLIYGALTAILLAIYFGSILALQQFVNRVTGQRQQSAVVIVLSTLLIAALFSPLRRSLQGGIDRRFYRATYDAARTLAAFGTVLRQDLDLAELRDHLIGVVAETMQPTHVSLWLRAPERETAR